MLDHTSSVSFPCFSNNCLKYLFRTLNEPDNVLWVKLLAAIGSTPGDVPPHISQAQSINLFLPADVHKRDLHQIHFQAWKKGLKSLYSVSYTHLTLPTKRIV